VGIRQLSATANNEGRGAELLNALKEIQRILQLYPQFGQPLRDLQLKPAQLWIGTVPPLVVEYFLDEQRRLVMVSKPMRLINRPGDKS
jgi:hypothetical protein